MEDGPDSDGNICIMITYRELFKKYSNLRL